MRFIRLRQVLTNYQFCGRVIVFAPDKVVLARSIELPQSGVQHRFMEASMGHFNTFRDSYKKPNLRFGGVRDFLRLVGMTDVDTRCALSVVIR